MEKKFNNVATFITNVSVSFNHVLNECELYEYIIPQGLFRSGISVFIPQEAMATKLSAAVDSGAPTACLIARAHILKINAARPVEQWFSNNVFDLARQKVNINKEGKDLILSYGKQTAKARLIGISNQSPIAIFQIIEGELSYDPNRVEIEKGKSEERQKPEGQRSSEGQKIEEGQRQVQRKKGRAAQVRGAYEEELVEGSVDSIRFNIAMTLEIATSIEINKGISGTVMPIMAAAYSLAQYIHGHNEKLFFERVLPVIRMVPMDFYTLFEPHLHLQLEGEKPIGGNHEHLIPTEIITEWYKTGQNGDSKITTGQFWKWYDLRIAEAKERFSGIKCYSDQINIIKETDAIRMNIEENSGISIGQGTVEAYKTLNETNKIGVIPNVFPQSLMQYYKTYGPMKLAQDSLSFFVSRLLLDAYRSKDPKEGIQKMNTGINLVVTYYTHPKSWAHIRPVGLKDMVNEPTKKAVHDFVLSTLLMAIPIPSSLLDKGKYPIVNSLTVGSDTEIFNIHEHLRREEMKIFGLQENEKNNTAVLRAIEDVLKNHLVPSDIAEKVRSIIKEIADK
jgi:hypothetical protein